MSPRKFLTKDWSQPVTTKLGNSLTAANGAVWYFIRKASGSLTLLFDTADGPTTLIRKQGASGFLPPIASFQIASDVDGDEPIITFSAQEEKIQPESSSQHSEIFVVPSAAGIIDGGPTAKTFASNVLELGVAQTLSIVGNITVAPGDVALLKIVPIIDETIGAPFPGGFEISIGDGTHSDFHVSANMQRNFIGYASLTPNNVLGTPLPGGLPFRIMIRSQNDADMTINALLVGASIQ